MKKGNAGNYGRESSGRLSSGEILKLKPDY